MLCQTCSKKPFCNKLCPEAELYAAQDHETRREHFTVPEPRYSALREPAEEPVKFTKTETKILLLLKKDFALQEVCFILGLSRPALRFHLRKALSSARQFPGKVFLSFYNEHQKGAYKWDEKNRVVSSNRTESLDASAGQILVRAGEGKRTFLFSGSQIELDRFPVGK